MYLVNLPSPKVCKNATSSPASPYSSQVQMSLHFCHTFQQNSKILHLFDSLPKNIKWYCWTQFRTLCSMQMHAFGLNFLCFPKPEISEGKMRTILYMILANVILLQVLHFLFGPFVFDNLPNIPGPAWYSHRKWQLYHRQKLQLILKYNKYKQNTLVVLYQNIIEGGQRYLMLSKNSPFLKLTLTFFLSQNLNLCHQL